MNDRPAHQTLGYALFLIGALLGLLFNGLATWADFEATNFDVSLTADAALPSLRCPVLLAPQETGAVQASFDNPTGHKLTRRVRFLVSHRLSSELQQGEFIGLPLSPGERGSLTWKVGGENLVWGRMILARVWQNGNYPLPSRASSCGMLVVDLLGLPGAWVSGLAVAGSLLCLVAGALFWKRHSRPSPETSRQSSQRELAMQALAVVILGGFVATLLGQWMLGVILVVLTVMLVMTLITHALQP